jgi:divalent metal cation (Fe/Co/Zn/Cd) transporter
MATAHPVATAIIVVALLALSIFLLYHLFRFARRAIQRLLAA